MLVFPMVCAFVSGVSSLRIVTCLLHGNCGQGAQQVIYGHGCNYNNLDHGCVVLSQNPARGFLVLACLVYGAVNPVRRAIRKLECKPRSCHVHAHICIVVPQKFQGYLLLSYKPLLHLCKLAAWSRRLFHYFSSGTDRVTEVSATLVAT